MLEQRLSRLAQDNDVVGWVKESFRAGRSLPQILPQPPSWEVMQQIEELLPGDSEESSISERPSGCCLQAHSPRALLQSLKHFRAWLVDNAIIEEGQICYPSSESRGVVYIKDFPALYRVQLISSYASGNPADPQLVRTSKHTYRVLVKTSPDHFLTTPKFSRYYSPLHHDYIFEYTAPVWWDFGLLRWVQEIRIVGE